MKVSILKFLALVAAPLKAQEVIIDLDLKQISPLQMSVGLDEVHIKLQKLLKFVDEHGKKKGLEKYRSERDSEGKLKHVLDVFLGPARKENLAISPVYYLKDGHHEARVYWEYYKKSKDPQALKVPCKILSTSQLNSKIESLSFDDFAKIIFKADWVWPFNVAGERGQDHQIMYLLPYAGQSAAIPISQLADDSCRSFVYIARKYFENECGNYKLFEKREIPFQEFYYANLARKLSKVRADFMGCKKPSPENFEIFRQQVGKSSYRQELPGWLEARARPRCSVRKDKSH